MAPARVTGQTWPRGRSLDGGIDEIPLPAWTGRLWLCGKRAIAPNPDGVLSRLGANTVVCLNERRELAGHYPSYVAWLDANRGPRAVWFPIPDLYAFDSERMRPLFDELVDRLEAGGGLIVHCGAGIGRAGTTAVALCLRAGMDLPTALDHVGRHRPMAGPQGGAQRTLLESLAQGD